MVRYFQYKFTDVVKGQRSTVNRLVFRTLAFVWVLTLPIIAYSLPTSPQQMLEKFRPYLSQQWNGTYFLGEHSGASDEKGVRTNADLSMIAAWLGEDDMAIKSLRYAYSTHKANKAIKCSDGHYWGSTSKDDHVWESSLWAFSVAFSAYLQWDNLTQQDKECIYNLLKAECNYEIQRDIPTGFEGDTKAEENGWETNILAATLGLFPNDDLAPQWFQRLREFAINCYSHPEDKVDYTVIDPEYDNTTVAQLHKGANLYRDYTLQNHGYFHTSYQNVVMQELGESALALKLFQMKTIGKEQWHTNALMHNNQKVMDKVLKWLALPDGELAMPNGNDWSLFLYDQVTSYSTMACFLRDKDALMLEEACLNQIARRQQTTEDGSWLLRPDVGARRMGVQAHRVLMTHLMHQTFPTTDLTPTSWDEFLFRYKGSKYFPCQKLYRFLSDKQFVCFCWSDGLKSYTGYFAPICADNNNIIVPFRRNGTGNIFGWYNIEGHKTNARPESEPVSMLSDNEMTLKGTLLCDDDHIAIRYTIHVTRDAINYKDRVVTLKDCRLLSSVEGPLALSYDPFTSTQRNLKISGRKATIDNLLKIKFNDTHITLTPSFNNNSILTSLIHSSSITHPTEIPAHQLIKEHNITYKIIH